MSQSKQQEETTAREANDKRLRQEETERWAAQDKYLNELVQQESENNRQESVDMRWLEREHSAQLKWEELGRQMYDMMARIDQDEHEKHLRHLERYAQAVYKSDDAERRLLDARAGFQTKWEEAGGRDDQRDFGWP
jgi:CRISPR/Cas system-associated endonuclease/helicase Cas3